MIANASHASVEPTGVPTVFLAPSGMLPAVVGNELNVSLVHGPALTPRRRAA